MAQEEKTSEKAEAPKKGVGNKSKSSKVVPNNAKYPRHSLARALRIPRAILDQNAGRECSDKDAAGFVGVGYSGPFQMEISSAKKYGLIDRPSARKLIVTELGRQILRPQQSSDEIDGLRAAVFQAPDFSEVYSHYRGERIPDDKFFDNALAENYHIPREKLPEFKDLFFDTLKTAELLDETGGKRRIIDVSNEPKADGKKSERIKKLGKAAKVSADDSCFVMMPFAGHLGGYYNAIYEPAITKAGLRPVRADDDIFGTGKIIDQVWRGIVEAKVLVAELTSRNPNVFYELGLAHALQKPVVLVSSREEDVPFDLQHIRVIYYDVNDPFWGDKLIEKVAENILSAMQNPEEAIFPLPA
ncbi:hypothetical protein [uncultured Erythrobacter sp.]|uniref:hypothetical protein n=1 Tax=uncultured Erythrobacter sp. TaxID=263913 RepID=UPI0026073249|nr:hypothetical protein [uncultured Erythrobacter sp.]